MTIITLTRNTSKLYRNNDNNVVQKLNTQVKLYYYYYYYSLGCDASRAYILVKFSKNTKLYTKT